MNYVCRSLSWWQTGVLVAELESEPSWVETGESWPRGIMVRPPGFLTVPIPMDVQMMTETPSQVVFELFMQRLTPLLTQLGMGLRHKDQISTALTSLVESARNSSSMPGYPLFTTVWITE